MLLTNSGSSSGMGRNFSFLGRHVTATATDSCLSGSVGTAPSGPVSQFSLLIAQNCEHSFCAFLAEDNPCIKSAQKVKLLHLSCDTNPSDKARSTLKPNQVFALLRCYAAYVDSHLLTFRDSLSVPSMTAWLLKIEPIDYSETSVNSNKHTLRNNSEERSPHLHRGGNLRCGFG